MGAEKGSLVDRAREALGGSAPPAGRERRSTPRSPARIEAAYEDVDRQFFLQVLDLSEGGVFLSAPEPPPTGIQARVTLELPGYPAILRLDGTVVRRRLGGEPGFAIQFDSRSLSPEARTALRFFLKAQRASHEK